MRSPDMACTKRRSLGVGANAGLPPRRGFAVLNGIIAIGIATEMHQHGVGQSNTMAADDRR
jgi:hypothetical protein